MGRKPRAREFNEEIATIVRRHWPRYLNAPAFHTTADDVMEFAARVTHYCPSRWNALVSVLRFITPHGQLLKRRPLTSRARPLVSPAQFSRLVTELEKRPRSHGGLVVRFLAYSGMRINEARLLKWSDVQKDFLLVPGEMTKNAKPKALPFIPGMRELLDALRAVATGARKEFVLPQRECKTALNRACRELGIAHLSHHDFRHIFTTRCLECGVDVPTVAKWRGDSDGGAMLLKRYFHLLDEHSRRMAAKVLMA